MSKFDENDVGDLADVAKALNNLSGKTGVMVTRATIETNSEARFKLTIDDNGNYAFKQVK